MILRSASLCLALCFAALPLRAADKRIAGDWGGCYRTFDGKELVVGNSKIKRTWICGEIPFAKSLTAVENKLEWISGEADAYPKAIDGWSVTSTFDAPTAVGGPCLQVHLVHAERKRHYLIRVFPGTAAIDIEQQHASAADSLVDSLQLMHAANFNFTNVELKDHTDSNVNDLVVPKGELLDTPFQTSGNVAYYENAETGNGLLFMKLAPLPHARAHAIEHDFEWNRQFLNWKGPGYNAESKRGYPCAVICYSGGRAGRVAAGQRYQRAIRNYVPGRDGLLLSNTWGDRSRDAKISEPFLIREIEAGKAMGVDVMEVDDGWQRGTTQNSAVARSKSGVWSGFWKADAKFWWPHEERLPNGLEPVSKVAKEKGLHMGLWYAPDSDDDFANWLRDAQRIVELHNTLGVDYFKLDSIVMSSEIAEHRVGLLMRYVIEATAGKVVIDLDVTAGVRPGYLGAVEVGTVFVENRYTDWGTYWPHKTLRNFWQLSEYIDPVRLRMEFLNNIRNADKKPYKDKPLAPASYPPAYLFASVMFSSPLAWFEVSELPEAYAKEVTPLVQVWRQHREAIHGGDIIPIGEAPDGHQWSGLCSVAYDRKNAYAVIFRELNDQPQASFEIPLLDKPAKAVVLQGEGEAVLKDGKLQVTLKQPQRYLFLKIAGGE